jgi:hypothetical protein
VRLLALALLVTAAAHAQTPVFTYQGRLADAAGNPAAGAYDFTFKLFDALSGGTQVGATFATNALPIAQGSFSVPLNFGAGAFPGADRWLEIAVRTNNGGAFTLLLPRQPVTSTPYALRALEAGSAGALAAGAVGGAALQNGAVDSSKIADGAITLADLSFTVASNTFWRLAGNSGTSPATQFLGTLDNQPLELRVNNQRALRLDTNSGVALGRNAKVAHEGAFVWADAQKGDFNSSGTNQFLIRASGGVGINVSSLNALLDVGVPAGRMGFELSGSRSGNYAAPFSYIENTNTSGSSAPALRLVNAGNSPDGVLNVGSTGTGKLAAFGNAAGEVANLNTNGQLTLKAGVIVDSPSANSNLLAAGLQFGNSSGEGIVSARGAGPNQWGLDFYTFFLPRLSIANNGNVGIGTVNPQTALQVAGTVTADRFVGQVQMTSISLPGTPPSGSVLTTDNTGTGNWNSDLRIVSTKATGPGGLLLPATPNLIAAGNVVSNGVIGATIGGGGGSRALVSMYNAVGGDYGTVAGGANNTALASYASVGGGYNNKAAGQYATVPGGNLNRAEGKYSLAAGHRALALDDGSFVWADSQNADFASLGPDQFLIRASGGVGIGTAKTSAQLDIAPVAEAQGFNLAGSRSGNYQFPLAMIQNNNATGNSGPALRLMSKGYSPDAVLNVGSTGTGKLAAFGNAAGEVANLDTNGALTLKAGVVVDSSSANLSTLASGLKFGSASGEGIASARGGGPNRWGLDFYTYYLPRLSIANNGDVGIGTSSPQTKLHVAGDYVRVDGAAGEQAYLGGDGTGNDVQVGSLNSAISTVTLWNAGSGSPMDLVARNASVAVLEIRGGSDLAEPFPVREPGLEPGCVMVIDEEHPGQLKLSQKAYDTRVAGVLSGAKGVKPGLVLRQEGVLDQGRSLALTGRVYVKADACSGAIQAGDLLTTSDTPGHAMKVTEPARAQGAILGKSMSALREGTGLVLVLVTLQ